MIRLIIFIVSVIFCIGCTKMFQPPPYAYEKWNRSKTSIKETKEFIRKCGYPSFLGEGRDTDMNEIALMHLCMEKNGFKYAGNYGPYCHRYPNLPACVAAAEEKRQGK